MKKTQSPYGIISFILALLPFTYGIFVLLTGKNIIKLIDQIANEALRESLGWTVAILLVLSLTIVPILSAFFGIIGLNQKNHKTYLAKAGLVIDLIAIFILGLVFFVF